MKRRVFAGYLGIAFSVILITAIVKLFGKMVLLRIADIVISGDTIGFLGIAILLAAGMLLNAHEQWLYKQMPPRG